MASARHALQFFAILACCCFAATEGASVKLSNQSVSNIQWAPAAPGARRAVNFDVFLPAFPTVRFTDRYRSNFISAFKTSYLDASWTVVAVLESTKGVTVRTQAIFSANPNVDWLPSARRVYDMLRTGTCAKVLYPGPWGLSSVQQVVFPYLVSTGSNVNGYVPGTMVHGLNFNLLLQTRTMEWLTPTRANSLLEPLQAMPETLATNLWKHTYVTPRRPSRVAMTIQSASYSARVLAQVNAQVKANLTKLWPPSVWGSVSILAGSQVVMVGGQVKPSSPPPARVPPPPRRSPSTPGSPSSPSAPSSPLMSAAPQAPVSPTADVEILYNGAIIGRATASMVPVFRDNAGALEQCTEVDPSNYPYTGQPIQAELCGQAVCGIYVGYRLVGFAPLASISNMSAESGGVTYHVSVEPAPLPRPPPPATPATPLSPSSPLPPDSSVELRYEGETVATAAGDEIPVIAAGPNGPVSIGTLDVQDYPYTGSAYQIERNSQILASIYVGGRLVGFVPRGDVSKFSAVDADGTARQVTVPPLPPPPPLPPASTVGIVYDGFVIAFTEDDGVPVIVDGPDGPVTGVSVDLEDYPYTGFAYQIEQNGQILVSVYVGQRLVGFVPLSNQAKFTAFADGNTYQLTVPPSPPSPPLPPTAVVGLTFEGDILASTDGNNAPVIVNGPDGPKADGSVDAAEYPYTGYAYRIERDGQILVSAYVGTRLVGFVPTNNASQFGAFANGYSYNVVIPPVAPAPPLPPGAEVGLVFDGIAVASTDGDNVPVVVNGQDGPKSDGALNATDYLYTGYAYEIDRSGEILISVYVGQRLVGFVPKDSASKFSAFSNGSSYVVIVPPLPPQPPLPDNVDVGIVYEGGVIASAADGMVPAIVDGLNGPISLGDVDAADYPYTGTSYEIERDGQILLSVYAGTRLVGFVPRTSVAAYSAFADGRTYDITVLPMPAPPPLPADVSVGIVFEDKIIASTKGAAVPLIVNGPAGPISLDTVNLDDYPYTGGAYQIEQNGQILVSVYVGERLVGFVPTASAGAYSAYADGFSYVVTVPPIPLSPPAPPGSSVSLVYGGRVIASTDGDDVPVIVNGASGPTSVDRLDASDYPWTGYNYQIVRDGQILVSAYVGDRLVGFVPVNDASDYTAYADGRTYDVVVPPASPTRPLPPTSTVSIVFDGKIIASTVGGNVPLVIYGADGPIFLGTVDAKDYPYTGTSYLMKQNGQILVSVYVGDVLVGFVPKNDAGDYSAYSDGNTYDVTVPPAPPSPPLPLDVTVGLVYDGKVAASTDGSNVPLIISGPSGPILGGAVDGSKYPYRGTSYEIVQDGEILISVYVGERLVGFVPKTDVEEYEAYANGYTYAVQVLTPPTPPPLPADAAVAIVTNGRVVASTDDTTVPLVVNGPDGPVSAGTVNISNYPPAGYAYEIERNGEILVSIYVDKRLVGFVPKADVGEYSAYGDGYSYSITVPPSPPNPPFLPAQPSR